MRVVQTPPRYAPYIGGVEVVAQVLAEGAQARGDDIVVVCSNRTPRAEPRVNGIKVVRLRTLLDIANTQVTLGLPVRLALLRWDVIHTHLPTPWSSDVSVLVAKLLGRRSVVHFHNPIVGSGAAGAIAWLYRQTLQRLTLQLANTVIVISQPRYEELLQQHPRLRGRLHVIRNGVNLDRFTPPAEGQERSESLLFVSVLDDFHAYKGLDVLLDALVVRPSMQAIIVGDGSKRIKYESRARSLNIADRVTFAGRVTHEELLTLYRTCGVFVLPSRYADHEGGSSLVALEAMACGMPVVLADGAGEIAWRAADWGAGLRVPSDDASALGDALAELVADPVRRRAMGRVARTSVEEHHSWDDAIDAVRDLYRVP